MDAGSRLLQNAVPIFLLFILIEMYVDRRRRTGRYRLAATWSDMATGTVSQVCDLLLKAAFLPLYVFVYEHARQLELEHTPLWHWTIALLGVDFLYYFWHRAGHEVRLLWAVHSVHHQSEDMNLAVALRQPAFQAPSVVLFFMPLALCGVTPTVLMLSYSFNLIYQFFVHTEAVRTLGWFEWLFNSPSHHRVHHGSNPQYLDKNYGGILIVWDRLFGTFAAERERVHYGITTPLASFNPVWANLAEFQPLLEDTRRAVGLRAVLRVWLGHPATAASPTPKGLADRKHEAPVRPLSGYVYWQAVVVFLVLGSGFLFVAHAQPYSLVATVWSGAAVLWSAMALLGWVEDKQWARRTEPARLAFVIGAVCYGTWVLSGPTAAGIAALATTVLLVTAALWLRRLPLTAAH